MSAPAWQAAALPEGAERRRLLAAASAVLDDFFAALDERGVSPSLATGEIRARLSRHDFAAPRPLAAIIDDVGELLRAGLVQVAHPRYFGLFNPTPLFPAIVADLLSAGFNPQLAAYSHAPAAVEIERHVIDYVSGLVGHPAATRAGHFTSSGSEANATGLLLALTRRFPLFATDGVRGLPAQPVFYTSADSHLSWLKIAHQCGLGRRAVRLIAVDGAGRLDITALAAAVAADRAAGLAPVLVAATAGTTGAGIIDPLPALAQLCARERLHLHADAAWAGAAVFSDRLRPALAGLEAADSVTLDAHKWLAVPLGAGMFLCPSGAGLHETFHVTTGYMPAKAEEDYYTRSWLWGRRFMGLKLFLALATLGRPGYAALLEYQAALGETLRERLRSAGWQVVNDTPYPLVCFVDPCGADSAAVAQAVVASGRAWLSTTRFLGRTVLRACITSFLTTAADVEILVAALDAARAEGQRTCQGSVSGLAPLSSP
ncbi:MAG: pyridoxal-dependent decarboxylase [Alphaproteobacteria bacterium]|nr:pyridoxal-dependent decarboxylase [Alphaproteobacteria bacterium]